MIPFSGKYPRALEALGFSKTGLSDPSDVRQLYVAVANWCGHAIPDGELSSVRLSKDALKAYQKGQALPRVHTTPQPVRVAKTHPPRPAAHPAAETLAPRPSKNCKLLWHFGVALGKGDPGYKARLVSVCQAQYVSRFGAERQILPASSAKAILSMMRAGGRVARPDVADAKIAVKHQKKRAAKTLPVTKAKGPKGKRVAPSIPSDLAAYYRSDDFLSSWEWSKLRYQVLLKNDGRCEACGAGKADGVRLHVDHIKPRSKFPELAMDITNLQCLCPPCNKGKSNWDFTDWASKNRQREAASDAAAPWERLAAF